MKPQSLRDAIAAAHPELARDPGRFNMWIDKGKIRSTNAAGRGFEWAYTLNIEVQEFTGHPSVMFVIICDWLRTNQPELLQPGQHAAFRFESDILDDKTVDLLVEIDLTERVAVTTNADGSTALAHLDEPATLFPDDDLPLVAGAGRLKVLFMDGEQVLPGPADG